MTQINRKKGVILAAGVGSRLDFSGEGSLIKPLIPVAGVPILLRAIHSLEVARCDSVFIVLGWQAEVIQKHICSQYNGPVELQFIFNQNYFLQNGLSVLSARDYVGDEFLLTMADHILDDEIMRLVRDHAPPKSGATLCVDYKLDTIIDIDDATKVLTEDGFIRAIGKKLKVYNCIDTGVFIGTYGLMDAISQIYNQKGDASLSDGIQVLADAGKMEALDIKNRFWQDVDMPDMLVRAEKLLREHTQYP